MRGSCVDPLTLPRQRQLWHKNVGSDGEDVAFCADANEAHVAIAGYTTSDLYSDSNGGYLGGPLELGT